MTTAKEAKVVSTGVAGTLATLAVFFWQNHFAIPSPYHLGEIEIGLFVTVVSFLAGPVVRKYEKMTGQSSRDDLIEEMRQNQVRLSQAIDHLHKQLREK